MPITTMVSASREIKNMVFNNDDTVEVTLIVTINGEITGTETFKIPATAVQPVLDSTPGTGVTIRYTLIAAVYGYLISNGLVIGQPT